ncbi:MAG: NADPH-dependent FMN reductase [Pseudonocardiales bacterium]|nr:MAG: NADPH-dependent FMN reductase [Pseudonocardiales bacterium]
MTDGAARIVGIGGSTSAASVTNLLLRACLDECAALGAQTVAFTGAQLAALPIYDANGDVPAAAATALVAAVRAADAVVIATPGYHGGMSGLVKNAIDHLELLRDDEHPYLDGRAVGVIVAASGWQACGTTLVSVRSAIHSLRGWPTPFGVTVNSAERHPEADGSFDERTAGALHILATQLRDFTAWRAAARATSAR